MFILYPDAFYVFSKCICSVCQILNYSLFFISILGWFYYICVCIWILLLLLFWTCQKWQNENECSINRVWWSTFRFMSFKMRFGVWVWYSEVSIVQLDDEYQQWPISCWRPHLSPKIVSNKFDSKALNTLRYMLSTAHSALSSGQGHQAYW